MRPDYKSDFTVDTAAVVGAMDEQDEVDDDGGEDAAYVSEDRQSWRPFNTDDEEANEEEEAAEDEEDMRESEKEEKDEASREETETES